MNGKIDRVPELRLFSHVAIPERGSYKITKTGYRFNHQHVIIRRTEFRGEQIFVRWKTQEGNNPAVTHPDWIGYQHETDFRPSKTGPRKIPDPRKVVGAVAFKNNPKRGSQESSFREHESSQEIIPKGEAWADQYDERDDEETNSEFEARMEAEEESKWRSYAPAPHYNY